MWYYIQTLKLQYLQLGRIFRNLFQILIQIYDKWNYIFFIGRKGEFKIILQQLKILFFERINEEYILDQYTFRSILQIMTREDYQQKAGIFDMLPKLNKPQILKEFFFFQYHVFLLTPYLGTPIKREIKSGIFYLLSYQKLLIDLKEIQQQIGLDNLLPTPYIHNLFIDGYNHNYCNFRINIFQTNSICQCNNFKMETFLYTLLTGEVQSGTQVQEMNQYNIKYKNVDFRLIRFSIDLIERYKSQNYLQQFKQYDNILRDVKNIKRLMQYYIEPYLNLSFYAILLRNNLQKVQENMLWNYYKILFMQEMIEVIENKIAFQLIKSNQLFKVLKQLEYQQCQIINDYQRFQNNNLLQNILNDYQDQNEQIQDQAIGIDYQNEMNKIFLKIFLKQKPSMIQIIKNLDKLLSLIVEIIQQLLILRIYFKLKKNNEYHFIIKYLEFILIIFKDLPTLQIDQIYKLFNSLRCNTLNLPDNIQFICPHTVICNLEKMEFEKKNCNICPFEKFPKKKYQLSGILYFLLGGKKEGRGEVQEFYQFGEDYFSIYGILSEELIFRSQVILINKEEYHKKTILYQTIKSINQDIQPDIKTYELKKYNLVIVNPGFGVLFKQYNMEEKSVVNSFKKFLDNYLNVLDALELKPKDFKLCRHNLFLGELKIQDQYFVLKFNLFYDYLCSCHQNKFSQVFYQFLTSQQQKQQDSYNSTIESIQSQVQQIITKSNDETDLIQLMELLEKYQQNQRALEESFKSQEYISFFSLEINYLLRQFNNDDQLWKGYKIYFHQEIIELIECSIYQNNKIQCSQKKQLFEFYEYQIQLIKEFKFDQSITLFQNIVKIYAFLIEQHKNYKFQDFDFRNSSQLIEKRLDIFQNLKQFSTFKDYLDDCSKNKVEPIFDTLNFETIQQYEESLKQIVQSDISDLVQVQ